MRITHLNTRDLIGGAAQAAFRLHTGLKASGHASRMLVDLKTSTDPDVAGIRETWSVPRRLARRAVGFVDQTLGLQYLYSPSTPTIRAHPFTRSAEVIHLHNLHGGYLTHRLLPVLSSHAPLVWTLHDMWPITGHCAFSYGCDRWKTGCGRCPHLSQYPPLAWDTTAFLWRLKRRLYRRSRLTVVAPSNWLADMARQSPLFEGCHVHRIPYGLDTNTFKPIGRDAARMALDIPAHARVVMFSAETISDPRKGATFLLQTLHRLSDAARQDLWLLTVGGGATAEVSLPVRSIGWVSSDHLMATCYAAADLFVLPTLADNLPNALIESSACGTPSLTFDTGGVRDIARHMETGYVARYEDGDDLLNGMQLLLSDAQLRACLGEQARTLAVEEFSLQPVVAQYVAVYQNALAATAAPASR